MTLINPVLDEAQPSIARTDAPKEMLSVSREGGQTLVKINSSSLAIIQECLRKAKYSLHEGWIGRNESPATLFGSAIHKALEVFYSGDPAERKLPKEADMEIIAHGGQRANESDPLLLRATQAFVDRAEPLRALPDSDKRSIPNGAWILYHYFKTYVDDPYVALIDEGGCPYVERQFSFTLYEQEGLKIVYFGTIDLIVKHVTTGDVLVCDHKTSSIVGADFYNRLKPNHQYSGYLLGAQRALGVKTNSFLVNCLQVKPKPVTARGSPPNFPRQVTTRDAEDFAEFRESVVASVLAYLGGSWTMGHVNACSTYGGCQFLDVCAAPLSLRENILSNKFTRKEQHEVK